MQPSTKEPKIKSSLRLRSKTPLEKDQIHKINTILMHLNNHNDSADFREPVDWRGLQLNDYLQIVKCPMDLGTVNNRFKDKKYKTVEQVLNDVQLIWDNCKLYNPKGSDIYDMADKLELSFRRMIKNYLPALKVTTVTSAPIRPITEPPFSVIFRPDRQEGKPSLQLKKQFIQKMSKLSEDDLTRIVGCIKQVAPKCVVEQDGGWARIQVQAMTNVPFYRLQSLMTDMLNISQEPDEDDEMM